MAPSPIDKSPLSSKKFVAYLFAEATWKIIVLCGLWLLKEQVDAASMMMWWFMITAVVITGFIEVAYIGGQAWLDQYVRVAHITTSNAAGAAEKVAEKLEGPTDASGRGGE